TCAGSASGGLVFHSRTYLAPGKPAVRVSIRLPRLRGLGRYPGTRVTVTVGIGLHGWTTFPAATTFVTVTHATATRAAGRLHAAVDARRGRFRVYGAWRCIRTR